MARKSTKTQNEQKNDAAKRQVLAMQGLQRAVDRACNAIHDARGGYAHRAGLAAKRGIAREVVQPGVDAIVAAVTDMQDAVNRAYAGPKASSEVTRRVTLYGSPQHAVTPPAK